ncbi:MAG: alpha-N-arabinofuranosidase [Eubacteriales bacterium]|nr:alpha-N-arabinofuranosidase [Eubacteriales bacterium]
MQQAVISLRPGNVISPIDNRLYSSFIEHMGRAVYTGVYEPGHPAADAYGFRKDVLELIKPLSVSHIRYPGGNFLSGYRWEDGVGAPASRPVRPDLAWFALEPNQVGTDEFLQYLERAGTKAMLAVNLGTRGPQDAVNLLEYCNFPGGTYYSDMRIKNGHIAPYGVKLWCLGNEMDGPWQICGKTAEEYGRIACETAKMMKWLDPSIELVACGSSYKSMPTFGTWERTVLRHCYEHVDYLSLHQYYQNNDDDLPSFLARNNDMNGFIREVAAICEEIKAEKGSEKNVYLSFDEWNVWYHYQKAHKEAKKWIVARPIEEEDYTFADALLVGSMLITLINNADVVKIACLAQLVNTLAPIMTEPGGRAWVQTTYWPFLYACRYGRGTALRADISCPSYDCAAGKNIPYIDCAAVHNEEAGTVTLFIVNKHLTENMALELPLAKFGVTDCLEWVSLNGYDMEAQNTPESAPVQPRIHTGAAVREGTLKATLPAASWNMLRMK